MAVAFTRRTFTVHDYARMRETGILTEDERVELIDGEIRNMSPIGPQHAAIVSKIVKLLTQQVQDTAIVSPQNPVRLTDNTEPQPDIAVLHYRDDFYSAAHPTADDILLVIEVADTTLTYDREEKAPRYAAAAVPEVWIVNIPEQIVEQYTLPVRGQYTHLRKVLLGDDIIATNLASVTINTSYMLG